MVETSLNIAPGQLSEKDRPSYAHLAKSAQAYLPPDKMPLLQEAYAFALQAHQGQRRESGEPYLEHPLAVATILVELHPDVATLAAALLHDVVEDCGVPLAELESRFGPEVSQLVDGCTKLSQLPWPLPSTQSPKLQAESLRKMLVAMAQDIRVIFIKLADRLHNMRTLVSLPPGRREAIARETLEIYAPLAHRLGIGDIKAELEDLSFCYLETQHYQQIADQVASHRPQWESLIQQVSQTIKQELGKAGIKAEVNGRSKHLYSIHQKLQLYADQGKGFADIHDLMALRVIVDTIPDCYSALGIIHSLWHLVPGEFNDYISSPKSNGYQSLHTTVMAFGTTPLEIQVRTREMHYLAEYGLAAHWRYKRGDSRDQRFEERIAWLRQLMEWHREFSQTEEFLESVKADIFQDQVFVYTPKGAIKELPAGATPVDFAYTIHTDLAQRCIGAKVNGRLVALTTELKNGDTVEILTSKSSRGPSRDWLNPALGFVKTSHARDKIRQWFKRQARDENMERGRQLLEKELRRLGLASAKQEELARLFQYENVDDFFVALGCGEITPHQIAIKLTSPEEAPRRDTVPQAPSLSGVRVLGVGDLLTQLGKCCHPLPGDEIVGFVTRTRGVTIHRKNCHSVAGVTERERLVEVDWGHRENLYPVNIQVRAWDRVGLLRDISAIVAEEKINMSSVTARENPDHTASIYLTTETRDIVQLSRLLSRLEGIKGVISAMRSGAAPRPNT